MKQKIDRLWNNWTRQLKLQRQRKEERQQLMGKTHNSTQSLFNEGSVAWLIVIVTFFLQCISLATTYEGSKVYFGGIILPMGISAPFLFAFSVQSIVFAMSHRLKQSVKKGILMVLLLATLCSTYFSYVGIYNHIHSPIQYLEERYKQIYSRMTDDYQLIRDEVNTTMKESVFALTKTLNQNFISLQKQVEENKHLQEKLDQIKVEPGKIVTNTTSVAKPNINHYKDNLDKYYSDMAKYHAAINTVISDTTAKDQELKNKLYEQEIKNLLGGKSRETFIQESIEVQTQKEQLERTILQMYQVTHEGENVDTPLTVQEQLQAVQNYIMDYIVAHTGDVEKVNTCLTQMYAQLDEASKKERFEDFEGEVTRFMLITQKNQQLMTPLETLYQKEGLGEPHAVEPMKLYTLMKAELNQGVQILNQLYNEQPINLEDEAYALHNLYVLPIKNLSTSSMAWFCLGFAVLVDGLTLLFALMDRKKKHLLNLTKSKQLEAQSDEAIEEILITTLLNNGEKQADTTPVQWCKVGLQTFLNHFRLLPEGMSMGYSMWCTLEDLEKYQVFVAVLCQFNLATILKGREIVGASELKINETKECIVLKTKVVLWANDKIAYWAQEEALEQNEGDKEVEHEVSIRV